MTIPKPNILPGCCPPILGGKGLDRKRIIYSWNHHRIGWDILEPGTRYKLKPDMWYCQKKESHIKQLEDKTK